MGPVEASILGRLCCQRRFCLLHYANDRDSLAAACPPGDGR
jgi:hypothetical protein